MNVSRYLFRGSNIEAYIVVSFETVVRSGTDLTCGTVGNRVSRGHPLPAGPGLSKLASRGLPWFFVLELGWAPA